MASTVHVVGAGLAGLSCAVALLRAGRDVMVHESAGHAGGRCRSFHDDALERTIDNGNHLVLSGNHAVLGYLAAIGASDRLVGPERAEFPFLDLDDGRRWTVRPNPGRLAWWILSPARRVPGTRAVDYLRGLRLARAGPGATVAECLDTGTALYRRFWEPLALSVLNARPEEGAAVLLGAVLGETFGRGEAACRPRIAAEGLSRTFVDPALALLGDRVRFKRRLRSLDLDRDRVGALEFDDRRVPLAEADSVVLAVPPAAAAGLVPGLAVPAASRAIVNGHFRLAEPRGAVSFLGLVGGVGQWLFVRRDVASVTVSAADALAAEPAEAIAPVLWREVARALGLNGAPLPAWRIVKEKRATFAQLPAETARRPATRTAWGNLLLAGDWTDTGLPATLEGAVRSGHAAAEAARSV